MYHFLTNLCSSFQTESPSLYIGVLILSMVIGFYLLTKGGDLLSDHCSNLAKSFGIPSVVVGLTVVSIATSAPELFTSIAAVTSGAQGLILGNIIGSNIANIGLILGISLLISPIDTRNAVAPTQSVILLILSFSFTGYLFLHPSHSLSTIPGLVLLIFIASYLFFLTKTALQNRNVKNLDSLNEEDERPNSIYLSCIMILIATIALWAGSDSLVFGAKNLATLAGVPEELVGFTLVAIGTSLPELAASLSLTKKGEYGMLLGNIVGSNIFNIALVGGVAGILGPITVSTSYPWIDYLSLLVLTGIFAFWLRGVQLKKIHGVMLLMTYLCASIFTWIYNS
ncbi:MAG: calcium/sodium antiporter [Opitutae bacterium]|jgi:cation:H+ antiporter|nr:calcium/sodium antiporter [Opitutae bacterium]